MSKEITSLNECHQLITLKNAIYLKSLGFDELCDHFYDRESETLFRTQISRSFSDKIWAPKISTVRDWLETEYNILITTNIHPDKDAGNLVYVLKVFEIQNNYWKEILFDNTNHKISSIKLESTFEELLHHVLKYLDKEYNKKLLRSLYFDLDLRSLQNLLNTAIEGKLSLYKDHVGNWSYAKDISKNEIIKNLHIFDENFKALQFDFSDYAQFDFESDKFVFEFDKTSVNLTIKNTQDILDLVLDIPYYFCTKNVKNLHDELILHRLDFYSNNTIKPVFK